MSRTFSIVAVVTGVLLACWTPNVSHGAVIILQPGADDLKDTWIWDAEDFDHGSQRELRTNHLPSFDQRILIEFSDLSAIPVGSTINSALLRLFQYDHFDDGTFLELGAFEITSPWLESVTYSTAPSINPVPDDVVTVSNVNGSYNWNIQTVVQQWVDGSHANNGVMIFNSGLGDARFMRFASSDITGDGFGPEHPGAEFTPILEIDFTPAAAVPEPSTLFLLGSGIIGLCGAGWRTRNKVAARKS